MFSPAPAHDRYESVVVTLCSGGPDGLAHHLSSEQMCFVKDLALDMAQFLVSAAGQDEGTEGALLLNECHIPLQECEKMDQSLALAFRHLTLPPKWSLLGGNNGEIHCRDNMLTIRSMQSRETLYKESVLTFENIYQAELLLLKVRKDKVNSILDFCEFFKSIIDVMHKCFCLP